MFIRIKTPFLSVLTKKAQRCLRLLTSFAIGRGGTEKAVKLLRSDDDVPEGTGRFDQPTRDGSTQADCGNPQKGGSFFEFIGTTALIFMDHVLRARRCAPAAVYNRRKKFCQHEAGNAKGRFIMDAGRSLTAECALKEHLNFRSGLLAGPGTNVEQMKLNAARSYCNWVRHFFP